ncbi:MAG: hypothetical protein ACNFW9_02550 [Candidatus Kerfeldbacteria bacterium]
MPLGEVTKTEDSNKTSSKTKRHLFFKKIKKIFWLIIILIIIIQGYLIATNFFSKQPNLKMCYDRFTCVGYCGVDSQKECYSLVSDEDYKKEYNFGQLIKGKINIIEFFNKNTKYCYCDYSSDLSDHEELYNFYKKNN